ncbi:MAG: hypothetical protein ABW321_25900, partial [Polyangiales bacterium]
DGQLVLRRAAKNTVVSSGAELLANLFCGKLLTPVNGIAVGTNNIPLSPPFELGDLTSTDSSGQPALTRAAAVIPIADFSIDRPEGEQRVRVTVRSVLPADAAVHPDETQDPAYLGEAALGVLSADGTRLEHIYNRVVFDQIPKDRRHELSLYWEISFPFGT